MQAVIRRTVRYARAQRTWFRRDARITWLRPDLVSPDELLAQTLAASLPPRRSDRQAEHPFAFLTIPCYIPGRPSWLEEVSNQCLTP